MKLLEYQKENELLQSQNTILLKRLKKYDELAEQIRLLENECRASIAEAVMITDACRKVLSDTKISKTQYSREVEAIIASLK